MKDGVSIMYSELRTYTSIPEFIKAYEGICYMFDIKIKKLDKETVLLHNTKWKLVKGKMTCLTK
jgi:hypothetical protein